MAPASLPIYFQPVPPDIETRPFTLHPETFAGPSFRLHSERVAWLYVAVAILAAFLLKTGLKIDWFLASLFAVGATLVFIGFGFMRYRSALRRPGNRQSITGVVVRLSDDEVRQDYSEGSFLAIKLFAIKKVRQIGDYYFVIADKRNTIPVLKTAFASVEESQEFYQRLLQTVHRA
jgi:hypothetical protein